MQTSVSRALAGRPMAASLTLHGLAALLIPALVWLPSTSEPIETVTFARISHIRVTPTMTPRPAPRALAPHESAKIVIAAPIQAVLARPAIRRHATPIPAAASRISSAPVTAAVTKPGTGSAMGEAVPAPTATPEEREVASTNGRDTGGFMPFGASQPDPVLDPNVLKQLAALGVHATIVVTVGEDGRTKNVAFATPLDGPVVAHIQALLADANWDPAVCGGGVSCEGRATIKL
jgi:hypothetical protein